MFILLTIPRIYFSFILRGSRHDDISFRGLALLTRKHAISRAGYRRRSDCADAKFDLTPPMKRCKRFDAAMASLLSSTISSPCLIEQQYKRILLQSTDIFFVGAFSTLAAILPFKFGSWPSFSFSMGHADFGHAFATSSADSTYFGTMML